jgi:peptidoglycan/LPS O-acetylase OafA/YrhL
LHGAPLWDGAGTEQSFQPPLADRRRAIYAIAAEWSGFSGHRQDPALDKALDTPDLIAARVGAALDFRPDINGLRALAVLGVVVFHADRAWLPGGFVGVDIFFVISGFLISRIILAQCAAGRFSLAMFYARRAKRILPALLVVVSFVWIVGWFMAAPTQFREIGGGLLGNSYFTVNFWLMRLAGVGGYFGADAATKPLLHLWSLSIEEQFYLVWSVLLLALFKFERRLVLIVILGLFVASFAASVVLTPIDPIAAFYLPWTRGWELALGALIAYREVFWLEALPYPSRLIANIGAGAGIALMLGAFLFLNETQPFPGWLAAVPTIGSALVIANPCSLPGEIVLGNRVAGFFGVISYPLYLWHWPLFAFARIWPGVIPTTPVLFALACVAVILAALTYRLIEQPVAIPFRRRPFATALVLVGLLALTGIVGRMTYDSKGFPSRFPPLVDRIFDYDANGAESQPLMSCFYQRDDQRYSLDEERKRAAAFFEAHHCAAVADRDKPTILIVGDSHAAHLFAGLQEIYGERANLLTLSSVFCVPLVENVATDQGVAGTPRCRAINDYVFEAIRTIKPDVLIVGGYFAQYDHEANWRYPGYLDALVAGARRLHTDGVRSIIVAGQVPTWAPVLPILVGRDVLERDTAAGFSPVGIRPDSLETDRALTAKDWGEGVRYVSQAAQLCGPEGCRRLIGENLPQDLLAVDYGHYSLEGSVFAVRTMLAPVLDAELARSGKN